MLKKRALEGSSNTGTLYVLLLQLCLTLCDPMDCCPSGSSVHGILQVRIVEWVVIHLPGDLPDPGIESMSLTSSALAGRFFTNCMTWEALSFSESICIGLWVHMFAICWNSEMKAEMCSWK